MTYRVRNIVIAVGLAVLAAILTLVYVTSYKRHVNSQQETVPVLVAASDIAVGTPGSDVVARGLLTQREVSRKAVVPGAITAPTQIRPLIVTQPIFAGEQVTTRRFGPIVEQGIQTQLRGTMRAVQVAGDENQLLAGTLRPGDHVDIILSIKYQVSEVTPGQAAGGERVGTRIVLRDIKVLATSGGGTAAKITAPNSGSWVILAVTDSQAQKLFFVYRNAQWTLALRPAIHPADSPTSIETIESVLTAGLGLPELKTVYQGRTTQ